MKKYIDDPPTLTDDNGVQYTPILGGYRVLHPSGKIEYLYFSPATNDSNADSVAFVYYDNGNRDSPEIHIVISEYENGVEDEVWDQPLPEEAVAQVRLIEETARPTSRFKRWLRRS